MSRLKLGPIVDEKPVKVTSELPASVHRDLVAYAEALGHEIGQVAEPGQLVAPMLARFMASDRGFARSRRIMRQLRPQATSVPVSEIAQGSETA